MDAEYSYYAEGQKSCFGETLPFLLEGLWLRYATLQNVIPSFPWIAPGWEKEGITFCHRATLVGAPLSPCAVVFGDVSALDHEVGDEAVEGAALVSEPELTRA